MNFFVSTTLQSGSPEIASRPLEPAGLFTREEMFDLRNQAVSLSNLGGCALDGWLSDRIADGARMTWLPAGPKEPPRDAYTIRSVGSWETDEISLAIEVLRVHQEPTPEVPAIMRRIKYLIDPERNFVPIASDSLTPNEAMYTPMPRYDTAFLDRDGYRKLMRQLMDVRTAHQIDI